MPLRGWIKVSDMPDFFPRLFTQPVNPVKVVDTPIAAADFRNFLLVELVIMCFSHED